MLDPRSTRNRAGELRKQGNYGEAAVLYRELWESGGEERNAWDGWGYAYCLRKLGRSQEAIEICYTALKLEPDHSARQLLHQLCGWCLYDIEIKRSFDEIKRDESRFLQAAEQILGLGKPTQHSAHVRTVLAVIHYLKKKPQGASRQILEWCAKVCPEHLSSIPRTGRGPQGPFELASDLEAWYAIRCKALYDVGEYEECTRCAKEALGRISKFHHDNDLWLQWRIALSTAALGDVAAAVQQLRELLSRRKEWFICERIAQYLYESGDINGATSYAVEAAMAPKVASSKDIAARWKLFSLMGKILLEQGNAEKAREHILLAAQSRAELDWSIPQTLYELMQQTRAELNKGLPSAMKMYRNLLRYWESLKYAGIPRRQGVVSKLSGRDFGFIRGEDGVDYFFKHQWFHGRADLLKVGLKVVFYAVSSPEPGKKDLAKEIRASL